MDILCTEEEILSLFHHMCHVVVGAVAPVANVDILPAGKRPVPVHDIAECAKFVFFMYGLEDGIRTKGRSRYLLNTISSESGRTFQGICQPPF